MNFNNRQQVFFPPGWNADARDYIRLATSDKASVFSTSEDITIGRNPDASFCVADSDMSRQHAFISNGMLYDHSKNGIWVKVSEPMELPIGKKMILYMGDTYFEVERRCETSKKF